MQESLTRLQFEIQKAIDEISTRSTTDSLSYDIHELFDEYDLVLRRVELQDYSTKDYKKILKQLKLQYRNAILAHHAQSEKKAREELMEGARQTFSPTEGDTSVRKREISKKFEQINQLLSEQVERSQLSLGSIQSSSRRLEKTNQVYKDELTLALSNAKKTLQTLSIRQKTDLALLVFSLMVFFTVVLYIVKERMSTGSLYKTQEEIANLKALISETLSRKGVLGKLKAELRSNIFSVLQQNQLSENAKLTRLKSSREGKLLLDMISEFLDFFDLTHTANVFNAETGLNDRFDNALRPVIIQEINLHQDGLISDEPLLFSLLRQFEQRLKAKSTSSINIARSRESLVISPKLSNNRKVILDDDPSRNQMPKQNIDLIPKSANNSSENLSNKVIPKPLFSTTLNIPQPAYSIATAPAVTISVDPPQSDNPKPSLKQLPPIRSSSNERKDVARNEPAAAKEYEKDEDFIEEDIPEDFPDDISEGDIDISAIPPPEGLQPSESIKSMDLGEDEEDDVKSDVTESLEELLEPSLPADSRKNLSSTMNDDDFF